MILIVDDKPENIYALKVLLESKKFCVDSAISGQEALKKVLKNEYALIILDVQMPGMDGFEVAEALSGYSKTKGIPVIFLSAASTEKKFITKGYDSGGIDYITKPVDPDILLLKVKTFYRLYEQTLALNEVQKLLQSEVTVRKKAQENLKLKLEYLHAVLECLPQIAFTTNVKGQVTFVNNNWFRFSDSASKFPQIHPDDEHVMKCWQEALQKGVPFESELRINEIATGLFRYHLLRVIPIEAPETERKWVGTFTDIQDQKEVESKKDEFMSIASHELKTPLTSVKAYIQLLERLLSQSPDKNIIDYINRAHEQVLKLENLISELLDISKIENGKLKMNKKYFDLEQMIQSTINTISNISQGSGIRFLRAGERFKNPVFADEVRIEQVLINFLTNAIKYSPGSGKIVIKTALKNDYACIAVQDFGIGIPEDKQKHIFSKFYRVEESSVKFQGLGIGLYICAGIIRQHQGTYGLESAVGKGTTVHFSIPIN